MMIEELAILINDFPGPENQTRCFLHILNLVVKSIIRQFDLPKPKKTSDNEEGDENYTDEATKEHLKLADEIECEEEITAGAGDEKDATEDNNVKGWIDEREEMTEADLEELEESVKPVKLLMNKVCKQLLYYLYTLLSNLVVSAEKGCVYNEELNNHCLTTVVYRPSRARAC